MQIDWRLGGDTNPFANLLEGIDQGREVKRQQQRDNLFAQRQEFEIGQAERKQKAEDAALQRQTAVGKAVATHDYNGARQAAGGDLDLLEGIGKLDAQRKAQLADSAEFAARQLYVLKSLPPDQQAARWQNIVPSLVQRGLDPKELQIDFSDPTAIDRELAEAMTLKEMIEQSNKDAAFKESQRANREREAQGRARVGIAADTNRRGWASFNERKKAGGFGTPGAFVPKPTGRSY